MCATKCQLKTGNQAVNYSGLGIGHYSRGQASFCGRKVNEGKVSRADFYALALAYFVLTSFR